MRKKPGIVDWIKDMATAWLYSGQPCLVVYKMRKSNSEIGILTGFMKPRPFPRIEIYFPLIPGEARRDIILHECAHLAYKDAKVSGMAEAEAAEIMDEISPENMAFYPPHKTGEEAVIRLVDMRRGGARIFGISRPLARAIGRLSRPRPVRAALWASVPVVMCAALVAVGSPAGAVSIPMPTGAPDHQPQMSEHVYELSGTCLRAVPKSTAAPPLVEASDMSAFMSSLPSRAEWSVSSVSCSTYQALHEAKAWGSMVYEQTSGQNTGLIYYPW